MTTPSGDFDISVLAELANQHNIKDRAAFERLRDFIAIMEYSNTKKSGPKTASEGGEQDGE